MSHQRYRGLAISRRTFLAGVAASAIMPTTARSEPVASGGTLVAVSHPGEPNVLTAAIVQTG
ncbi:hypothetical protein J2X43_003207 [Rhizobium sp. BE258]|nr:hypothetical protein [Rhizobium sp. BE258]